MKFWVKEKYWVQQTSWVQKKIFEILGTKRFWAQKPKNIEPPKEFGPPKILD